MRKIKIKFWQFLEILKLKEYTIQVSDKDMKLCVNLKDDSVAKPIYLNDYETETTLFLAKFIHEGDEVIDIGANIGYFTLLLSSFVGDTGVVHSFEPSQREFNHLVKNVGINQRKNVFLNQLAVSDHNGNTILNVLDCDHFGAFNSIEDITHQKVSKASTHAEKTRVIKIDTYVDLFSNRNPSLIKVDVEGLEKQVLEGMQTLLGDPDAPCLILEVCEETHKNKQNSVQDLLNYLIKLDYKLFSPDAKGNLIPFVLGKSLNCVAIKKNHTKRLIEMNIQYGLSTSP